MALCEGSTPDINFICIYLMENLFLLFKSSEI